MFATLGTIGVNSSPAELTMLLVFGFLSYGLHLCGYPLRRSRSG